MINSVKNLEDEIGKRSWSLKLQKFLREKNHQLETSKFKGELFYFKYSRDQKAHIQQIQLLSEVAFMNEADHSPLKSQIDYNQNLGTSIEFADNPIIASQSEFVGMRDTMKEKHIQLLKIA